MAVTTFESLPPSARLWIFEADRELTRDEIETVGDSTTRFLEKWTAHGASLRAGMELRYGRFLFVAVDQSAAGASGCSIDALFHFVRDLGQGLGVSFMDRKMVSYRRGDAVKRVSRAQFGELARQGEIGPATTVFNNTLTALSELQEGKWEIPAAESWHRSMLG